jgi:hypothetical protein
VLRVVEQQAAELKNPPSSIPELLETREARGLVQTAAELRRLVRPNERLHRTSLGPPWQ